MKITDISIQAKNNDRVNISVDGVYRFSLDVFQLGELGIKRGNEYTEEELEALETESLFGKLYARAVEYTMLRPHSSKELRDYLWKKTLDKRGKEGRIKKGYSPALTQRVYERILAKGYVNDEAFTRFWVQNRHQAKGASRRKLISELRVKGIESNVIETVLADVGRNDQDELAKMMGKKRAKYPEDVKLMQYLVRQGFSYDDVKRAITKAED
jgi:regulatory protein